jgi:histidinol-phosphate aminotransferase
MLNRRSFIQALGFGSVGGAMLGAADLCAARGREALSGLAPWERETAHVALADPGTIKLSSNENPLGPGDKALAAIHEAFGDVNRYPNTSEKTVQAAIARTHRIPEDCVVVGCGSSEILRAAVMAYTRPGRPLIAGTPTFEDPAYYARALRNDVIELPVDRDLRLDLDRMAAGSGGAGLIFLCNPNNPTGTVHGAAAITDFVTRVNRSSPGTTILIDEAYHEYVDDPAYRSAVSIAGENPRVIVSRTFSKVFGLAGLRIGYAIGRPEALAPLRAFKLGEGVNVLAAGAAAAALKDVEHVTAERTRNQDVRRFTCDAIAQLGYTVIPSQTNFVMIDVRRNVQTVIDGCKRGGVLIGRPFPPLTTWARVSIGTMEEMQRALDVLKSVLSSRAPSER